jgi:hypothetical protein
MKHLSLPLCVTLVLGLASFAAAEDKAATAQLPAALQAMGVVDGDLVSEAEASAVRGQSYSFEQHKLFRVEGTASGTITLIEGMIGNIQAASASEGEAQATEALFGGLEGHVSVGSDGISFELQGKALQEVLDFNGSYVQEFLQSYVK